MGIELTLVHESRSLDVLVPPDVPLAELLPDLQSLLGESDITLRDATGRPLAVERSFADNLVGDGSILQSEPGGSALDIFDELREPTDRRGSAAAWSPALLAVSVAAGAAALGVGRLVPTSVIAIAAAGGLAFSGPISNLVIRLLSIERSIPDRFASLVTRMMAAIPVVAALALVFSPEPLVCAAGWAGLLGMFSRSAGHDDAATGVLSTACVAGILAALASEQYVIGGLAACVSALLLWSGSSTSPPAAQLGRERFAVVATVLAPAALLIASGVAPWPW